MCAQVCAACPSGGRVGGRGREGTHTHTHICRHMYILQLALYVRIYIPVQDSDKRHINLGLGPSGVHVVMGTVHVAVYDW